MRARAVVAASTLAAAGALVASGEIDRSVARQPSLASLAAELPAPVAPAFTVRTPRPLAASRRRTFWAPVLAASDARAAPRPSAPMVATLDATTPEGTANVVLVLGHVEDRAGRAWAKVRLPALPNGTTGWVPRAALGGYVRVDTRLVVDQTTLTATLFRNGRAVFRAPVGVGEPAFPTPVGEFYIRNRLTRYRSPTYGPLAFGTSARSAVLTDWPAGGFIGIHGTDRPDLIPGRISHGCIRLRNGDILRLARLMPVGTPVTIR